MKINECWIRHSRAPMRGWWILSLLPFFPLVACGPWFPNSAMEQGDRWMEGTPPFRFSQWTGWIAEEKQPSVKVAIAGGDHARETAQADQDELAEALARSPLPPEKRSELCRTTEAIRRLMGSHVLEWAGPLENREIRRVLSDEKRQALSTLKAPDELPSEFRRYLQGALAYHQMRFDEARQHWQAVLDLPMDQRHYRTVWATFMIGKSWLMENQPQKAIPLLVKTRQCAREGFADRLGLAACSLGWEALAEWACGQPAQAAELYLEQIRTGDPSAIVSLRCLARHVLRDNAREVPTSALQQAVRNPILQQVVTAYVNCFELATDGDRSGASKEVGAWLKTMEGIGGPVKGTEGLAWVAYQLGDLATARRWLKLAPEEALLRLWLESKLALRAGQTKQATKFLIRASRRFPKADQVAQAGTDGVGEPPSLWSQLEGEIGLLFLRREQFVDAFDMLLRADFWEDAAYLAERVLTVKELTDYVNRHPEFSGKEPTGDAFRVEWGTTKGTLRYLLGRRLVRLGRFEEARRYLSQPLHGWLDDYAAGVKMTKNVKVSAEKRAEAIFLAAKTARHWGMELMGTEVEPDWTIYGGDYDLSGFSNRRQVVEKPSVSAERKEIQRLATHEVKPNKRFHYRYLAAELAWEAARLMPNQSERTAEVLCLAGNWLRDRDDQTAERFYQALVRRCSRTQIGLEAERIRWFPKIQLSAQSDLK